MPALARIWYRCRQFVAEIRPRPLSREALTQVRHLLSDAEWELFQRFTIGDQSHSYAVMRTLSAESAADPMLLKAALLHDIGKTRARLRVWDRVAIVLGEACAPRLSRRWGQGQASGWRRPFVVKARHPEWGAELARAAGSPTALVELIRLHQAAPESVTDPETRRRLSRLQRADEAH